MEAASARAIFVSPHLDDVALSCGATAARSAARGEHPLVVTICTADPELGAPITPFAQVLHARWSQSGTPVERLWQTRRDEESLAMADLGIEAQQWLGYLDALYRGYQSSEELFGPHKPDDRILERLTDELVALWRKTAQAIVHLPLAVGGHVDHRVCYELAEPLEKAGAEVWHYEDYPYSILEGAVERRIVEVGGQWTSRTEDVTELFERRLLAISRYSSQIPHIFRNYGGQHEEITRHIAADLSGAKDRYAERFWRRTRNGPPRDSFDKFWSRTPA